VWHCQLLCRICAVVPTVPLPCAAGTSTAPRTFQRVTPLQLATWQVSGVQLIAYGSKTSSAVVPTPTPPSQVAGSNDLLPALHSVAADTAAGADGPVLLQNCLRLGEVQERVRTLTACLPLLLLMLCTWCTQLCTTCRSTAPSRLGSLKHTMPTMQSNADDD
jgi:hypothetical protein